MSSATDPFRETAEFKRGRNGEQVVAAWLRGRGWYVIPSYDYAGEDGNKAPKMTGPVMAYVLPDLDVARMGERLWAEVKTKGAPTLHRKTGIMEHGISYKHFKDYKVVEQQTGCKVFVFIYEENTQEILMRPLGEEFEGRVYAGARMGKHGMIFWPRVSFRKVAELQEAA